MTKKEQGEATLIGGAIGMIITFVIYFVISASDANVMTPSKAIVSVTYYILVAVGGIFSLVSVLLGSRYLEHLAKKDLGDGTLGFLSGITGSFGFANWIFPATFPQILSYILAFFHKIQQ